MASGLADLYGVFSDHLLVFLFRVRRAEGGEAFTRPLQLPGFPDDAGAGRSTRGIVKSAWQQVNALRTMFFGFGTKLHSTS